MSEPLWLEKIPCPICGKFGLEKQVQGSQNVQNLAVCKECGAIFDVDMAVLTQSAVRRDVIDRVIAALPYRDDGNLYCMDFVHHLIWKVEEGIRNEVVEQRESYG